MYWQTTLTHYNHTRSWKEEREFDGVFDCKRKSIKRLLCKDRRRNDQLIEVRSRTVKNVSFAFTHAAAARISSAICGSTVCVIVRLNACVWWDIPTKQHTYGDDDIFVVVFEWAVWSDKRLMQLVCWISFIWFVVVDTSLSVLICSSTERERLDQIKYNPYERKKNSSSGKVWKQILW